MSDHQARAEAVDPHRSIIVQAPAGSGKTTLLVERYLGLLDIVDAPEEILAITFTRKAAAEMRERVLRYLDPEFTSTEAHEQAPMAKARAVRDKAERWHLRENPQRLLIRTIDSFNHYLARTMPVASALGPVPAPADNSQALYRQAARNVLGLLEGEDEIAVDLQRLLDWRDHRGQDIESLLADLLGKREQWLRALSISGTPQRQQLEAALYSVVTDTLAQASQVLHGALSAVGITPAEVVELLRSAARTLIDEDRQSPIRQLSDLHALPQADPGELPIWAGLTGALLTNAKGGAFRRKLTIAEGFRPQSEEKARFQELLNALADHEALSGCLNRARSLPDPRYSDLEWEVLDSLVRVLRRSAIELELVFARSNQTDYPGLAAAALRGLGDEETGYTDLGLYLDRRIQHLLVDEFQDTNWSQFHLLEKLTAGWEPGDGRSLFLVGDPMQSIYRFREAEVGLFIRSRDQGVGSLMPEAKALKQNFRSRAEIVGWVNERLGPIFPQIEDISTGAVAYEHSEAGRSAGGKIEVLALPTEADEAEAIVELAARALTRHADSAEYKAAIIVRARSHLQAILPALKRRGIAYRAVKLDPLLSRSVVQDLLALTRAVCQPADVAATLAVLRSPVCGLTLTELHALGGDGRSLADPDALARLDPPARRRAGRVFEILHNAQEQWQRRSIRDLVEGAWHGLGGPACCQNQRTDLEDARLYLDSLELASERGLLDDWNDFLELLDGQTTAGDPPSENVKLEILTMHGAKGLEWDLVILPGLNKPPGGTDSTLLHWLPFTPTTGGEGVLLAPLRAADAASDPALVELIRNEQTARSTYENQRLLYVACTRAKEQLVLSACLDPEKEPLKPNSGSLLAELWPTTHVDFETALTQASSSRQPALDAKATAPERDQTLRRVDAAWEPHLGERMLWQPSLPRQERQVSIEYNWAGMQARRTGTVLHRLLERVGIIGIESLTSEQTELLIRRIPLLLRAMGTRRNMLEKTAALIQEAFEGTLHSDIGRWILSNRRSQAACELAVSGIIDGQLVNAVIDRTFVDADEVRWIIDYKSGYHAGADLQGFLTQESERYQEQLGRYRQLFAQMEDRTIKTALYLPRHCSLQVVDPSG
jgi:ATP-dependent exoDNAse (exonuclease V) beta subunit